MWVWLWRPRRVPVPVVVGRGVAWWLVGGMGWRVSVVVVEGGALVVKMRYCGGLVRFEGDGVRRVLGD